MPTQNLKLAVRGMTCGNCARTVQRKLSGVPGVTKAAVDLEDAAADIQYDPDLVNPAALADAVRQLGYEAEAGV
jgi:copper chaperone CopZ